jgi:hypothetical protein
MMDRKINRSRKVLAWAVAAGAAVGCGSGNSAGLGAAGSADGSTGGNGADSSTGEGHANDGGSGARDGGGGEVTDGTAAADTSDARDAGGASDAAREVCTTAPPLAFPGAVGFGASATGGRGSAAYHVTNLNDTGTGSFRDAVGTPNRTIVFDVGGIINSASPVSVSSNLTIAGQTAPGGGIAVEGRELSFSNSSNVIVRDMRFRQGTNDPDTGKSAMSADTSM